MKTAILSPPTGAIASAAATPPAGAAKLVRLANGEYTAASVSADQSDASKLGLVKEKDGNYGTKSSSLSAGMSAAAQASSGVQAALTSLKLGGA